MIRKTIAALLAALLLLATVPMEVWAGTGSPPVQQPREGRPIDFARAVSGDNPATAVENVYTLLFSWNAPPIGTPVPFMPPSGVFPYMILDDYHLSTANPGFTTPWTNSPSRFTIGFENRSVPGATPPPDHVVGQGSDEDDLSNFWNAHAEIPPGTLIHGIEVTRELMHSSLYQINIVPHHYVPVWVPGQPVTTGTGYAPGTNIWTFESAPVGSGQTQSIIFLTDIQIRDARGTGNEIVVEWYNPLWDGQDAFAQWELTLRETGPAGRTIVPPLINSADAHRLEGGRVLRYTIRHDALQIGSSYVITIEPMHSPAIPARRIGEHRPPVGIPGMGGAFFTYRESANFAYAYHRPVLLVPQLTVNVEGANFVRLTWPRMAAAAVGYILVEQWPYPFPNPEDIPNARVEQNIIATIPRPLSQNVIQWVVGQITPLERRAYSIAILDQNGVFLARSNLDYFLPGIAEFTPYSPDLAPIEAEVVAGHGRLSLIWRAFTRAPYTPEEVATLALPPHSLFPGLHPDQRFIDFDLHYRVFVSNSLDNLLWNNPEFYAFPPNYNNIIPNVDMFVNANTPDPFPLLSLSDLASYTRRGTAGAWVTDTIRDNAVYFVRIEAVRSFLDRTFISEPSFGVIYIPPQDDILLRPGMIDAPPLRFTQSNPGEEIQITLEWDLRYLEIGDPAGAGEGWNRWHASAGVDMRNGAANEQLVFGRAVQFIPESGIRGWGGLNHMLNEATRVRLRDPAVAFYDLEPEARAQIGARLDFPAGAYPPMLPMQYPLRVQDLYSRHYRIHVTTHAHLMAGFGNLADAFYAYRDMLMNEANADLWEHIGRPVPEHGISSHPITDFPGLGDLEPNTTYVIFMQPYEPLLPGAAGRAFYPNYIIVTTPQEFVPAVPRPTTPVLFPGQMPTDRAVSVRWRVQGEQPDSLGQVPDMPRTLFYELRWSETILDYPEGGRLIAWEDLDDIWGTAFAYWRHPVTRQWYYHLTVTDLFPDTMYYVWVRAYNAEGVYSVWSNPIEQRTREIVVPPPPRLGPASRTHLHAYNLANDTDYQPMEPHAITLFVSRVFSDFRTYALPRATDGEVTGGSAELLDIPALDEIYAVRFFDLFANRPYFTRARTILTIPREGPPEYSYEIQLADNPDFLDAITFTIPPLTEMDNLNMRRAISAWVDLELATLPGDDEFDGAFRPEQFPMPEYDWEVTYRDGTLAWRFRTDGTGADGRPDQQADQRFISRLINSRVHRYEIDLRAYASAPHWPVRQRELILPLSIIRAFDERLITLVVHLGDITVEIPPGAFDTQAVRALGMGAGAYMRLTLETLEAPAGLPTLPFNNRFVTLPQRLSITAVTPLRSLTLTDIARPMHVTLHTEAIAGPGEAARTGLFYAAPHHGAWQDAAGMHTATRVPAVFAGVLREAPRTTSATPQHPSLAAMERVTARITFTDIFDFNPAAPVSPTAFNNIIYALATNRSRVALNAPLTNAARNALTHARFLAPDPLTFETAADILVRFYELRTRQRIEPMTPPEMVIGISGATPAMHTALLKAADIGFIYGPISPQAALTMGDLMIMLDVVIRDINF